MSPWSFLPLITILLFNSSAHTKSFNFSGFNPTENNLTYYGDASNFNNSIQLNRFDLSWRVGRVKYVERVQLWDSSTKKLADFNTHFSFTLDTLNDTVYSDGLTFFLGAVDSGIPHNSWGGYLGLCNYSSNYTPICSNPFVAVEFDSYANQWDPPYEHVGISISSLTSATSVVWNASMHSGDLASAWVRHDPSTKMLSVSLTYQHSTAIYSVSQLVDFMQVLPEWVIVGFTASTGLYPEKHVLHSWAFSSTLEMKAREGMNTTQKRKAIGEIRWEVGLISSVGVLLLGVAMAWFITVKKKGRTKKSKEEREFTSMAGVLERRSWPMPFSYEELSAATGNFSDEKKLGEGGFGDVYMGFLIELNMTVAVKKISRRSKQGKKEYITEVKIIGQLRHRNLVQLIGWCHDHGDFLLVYEYMPNGSLDSHLYGKTSFLLTWAVRYKIATGLTSALLYLHNEWVQCVVHRDIKPGNIMLDSDFNAKLGDFGLARLLDHEMGAHKTVPAGTFGYLAPECFTSGNTSKESDVYSFGVVALEIACGRKAVEHAIDGFGMRLVEWVWELHANGRLLEAADKRLGTDYDLQQMERLMIVGLWCAQPEPKLRPCMRQVMRVLEFEEPMPALPIGKPITMPPQVALVSTPPSISSSVIGTGR